MENKRNEFLLEKGITLVALVVTIIVLLILAGVTLNIALGQNSLLTKAKKANQISIYSNAVERVELALMSLKSEILAQLASNSEFDSTTAENTEYLGKNIVEKEINDTNNWIVDYSNPSRIYITYYNDKLEEKGIDNNTPKHDKKIDFIIELDKQDANLFVNEGPLSTDYQEVEYIESQGNQFINTEVIGKNSLEMQAKIMYTYITNDGGMLGARNGDIRIYPMHVFPSKFCIGYGSYYSSDLYVETNIIYNIYSSIYSNEQVLSVDGNTIMTKTISNEYNTNLSLYLFAINSNNTANYFSKFRLYKMKIYDNKKIVRNFVPCYCTTDVTDTSGKLCPSGTIGLYDLVENKFFSNQGTGEFLKGENI